MSIKNTFASVNYPGAGNRIKELREGREETQESFASAAGVQRTHLAAVEAGKRDPSLPMLTAVVKLTGASLDWLLFGKGPKRLGGGAFSREEELLVQKYRQLRPGDRTRAQEIVSVLASATVRPSKKAGS